MNKVIKWLLIVFAAFWLLVLGWYLANPHNTASWDPLLRTLGSTGFTVNSSAMEPTLAAGDQVVVQAYGNYKPRRGDVIAFKYRFEGDTIHFKRVIAEQFDKVQISAEQQLSINGKAEYATSGNYSPVAGKVPSGPVSVGQNAYVVLPDNDKIERRWGIISSDDIIGHVVYVLSSDGSSSARPVN